METLPKGTSQPTQSRVGSRTRTGTTATQTAPATGAHMGTNPMVRTMKYYPILEEELDNIGAMSRNSSFFLALASGSFSACLTLVMARETLPISVLESDTTELGRALLVYGPWVFGFATALFGIVGVTSLFRQHFKVKKIRASATEARISVQTKA